MGYDWKRLIYKKMKNYLYCYKMTWDTESAPNPHHGVLTLAICKPTIRRCSQVGDWISGWTAKVVHGKNERIYSFDYPKLIYLARVQKKLTFAEYWIQYTDKYPHEIKGNKSTYDSGDNIYKPLVTNPNNYSDYEQVKNNNHTKEDIVHDLSGKFVLICEEFYYYGVNNAIDIEKDVFNVTIPRCKKLVLDDYDRFISYVRNDKRIKIKGKI